MTTVKKGDRVRSTLTQKLGTVELENAPGMRSACIVRWDGSFDGLYVPKFQLVLAND